MFDAAPGGGWLVVLALSAYILTAMVVSIIREELPGIYEEISAPSDVSGFASLFYLAFNYIIPLKYESWELSRSQKSVCRLALVVYVSLLLFTLWSLASFL